MPLISASLLGTPVIAIDGSAAPPEMLWRKHLGLCIALWCAPDRQRSRDQLISMLWGDKAESAARHSLNEALRVVRRNAGDDAIATGTFGVKWTGNLELDSEQPEDRWDQLARGEFCEGFSIRDAPVFDEWLDQQRREWRPRLVRALDRAVARAEDAERHRDAVRLASRASAIDPLSNVAARSMIRSLWLAGDRSAAMAYGAAFAQRVHRELGAEVEDDTRDLQRRISQATARRAERDIPTGDVLVGRAMELDTMLRAWRSASAGAHSAPLLLVNGDAGSGRSRMLAEFASRATLDGATVARVLALDVDRDAPESLLLGLAAALAGAPGIAGAHPHAVATLAARLPAWADRYPGMQDPGMPVGDALAGVLHAVAQEHPVVLLVDDIERLGDAGMRQLLLVIRQLAGQPVTLVSAIDRRCASAGCDELRRMAGRDGHGCMVELQPLGPGPLRELVASFMAGWTDEDVDRLTRRIMVESAGLPALAVEVLRGVKAGLSLEGVPGAWPAEHRTLDATLPGAIPQALTASIRLQFRELSADARLVLQLSSLLEAPFQVQSISRLAEMSEGAALAAIDTLEQQGWLRGDARGYSFRALAVRRVIASDMLTPGARRRLEERIATSL